jgi:hypothetical protein
VAACTTPTPPPPAPPTPTPAATTPAPEITGSVADWWIPQPLDVGTLIGEGSSESWNIKIYQIATSTLEGDLLSYHCSQVVDPTLTVLLSLVYTNIGDTPIELGTRSYMDAASSSNHGRGCNQHYDSANATELLVAAGFPEESLEPSSTGPYLQSGPNSPPTILPPYPVRPGESFAWQVSRMQWAGPLDLSIDITPLVQGGREDDTEHIETVNLSVELIQ